MAGGAFLSRRDSGRPGCRSKSISALATPSRQRHNGWNTRAFSICLARACAYPRETVVAEKLHAMVLLGMRNSRMKDYFDVYALLREEAMDAGQLVRAIRSTFERRRTHVPAHVPTGLSDAFSTDAGRQAQWRAFLAKNRLRGPSLPELVDEIRKGLAPSLEQARRKVST